MMDTIAEMTREELKRFVEQTLHERLTASLGAFEMTEEEPNEQEMTWDEIRAMVKQHRWTPPAHAKSSLELLREDREG